MKRDLDAIIDNIIALARRLETRVRASEHDRWRRRAASAVGREPVMRLERAEQRGISWLAARVEGERSHDENQTDR